MIRILKKQGACLMAVKLICSCLTGTLLIPCIENITLMFTWKFIYNCKFSGCPLNERPDMRAYEGLVHLSIPISLIAKNIINILNDELQRE